MIVQYKGAQLHNITYKENKIQLLIKHNFGTYTLIIKTPYYVSLDSLIEDHFMPYVDKNIANLKNKSSE